MWLTMVLAISLVREPVFGRRRAVLTTNVLIFLTASQFYSLYKTLTHTHTCSRISISNPEKQFSKLKTGMLGCL